MTDATEAQLLLAEYEQLKSEQRNRIQFRDGLMYTTLASLAATVAATIGLHTAATLLLLPPVSVLLGWKYLANDAKISAMGAYVRAELAPRLAELSGAATPVFGWEASHQRIHGRNIRMIMQIIVDLIAFCVMPTAGLIIFWTSRPVPPILIPVSGVEALLCTVLGAFAVAHSWPFARTQ